MNTANIYITKQKACWECYNKYIEQNCFRYCLCIQWTNKVHLSVVAWSDCQEVMTAR